jgi:hypothetical protein
METWENRPIEILHATGGAGSHGDLGEMGHTSRWDDIAWRPGKGPSTLLGVGENVLDLDWFFVKVG